MAAFRRLVGGLRALVRRRRDDDELSDELRAYLDAAIEAKIAAGMSRADATRAARVELGSAAAVKDHVRDVGWEIRIEHAWLDIRRGLRAAGARGWRGAFVALLLGVALAADTVVFSAADSFVLRRVPYPNASRLVEIGEVSPFTGWSPNVFPETVPVWRVQRDLFAAFYGYQGNAAPAYVASSDGPRLVQSANVEPGLLETLGARPVSGRLLVSADASTGAPPVALVAEELARDQFGSAASAVGKTLTIGKNTSVIVGVLPTAFRFPSGNERIWLPLNVAALAPNRAVYSLGVMASRQSIGAVAAAVEDRASAVMSHTSPPWNAFKRDWQLRPIGPAIANAQLQQLFLLLCAAAGCLLLVACANVVNLELAAAVTRARLHAIALALGASRRSLVRATLVEGAAGMLVVVALAAGLANAGTAWLAAHLPDKMTKALVNPLDVDARALWFMIAIAIGVWLLTSLPVAIAAVNASVLDALKLDSRTLSGSRRSGRLRDVLTVSQMAVTVVVLVGASLSVRTYNSLLAISKGFDTTGLVSVDVRLRPGGSVLPRDLNEQLLAHLRARPDVLAASMTGASPPATAGSVGGNMKIDGRPEDLGRVQFGPYDADADFFTKTMRLPIREGRDFRPDDPPNAVIVDELFARRFWPNGHSVGATFQIGAGWPGVESGYRIVGVAGHLRSSRDDVTSASELFFPIYRRSEPLNPYSNLAYAVRLTEPSHIDDVRAMVRALAPGALIRVDTAEERYGEAFANQLMAASIMSAFGGVAFVIAIAGIYGVMAFFVAARTREIGVRIAVGADRVAIARLVLGSAARLIIGGALVGAVAALAVSRLAASLLFGVTPTDPRTYLTVVAAVVVTALFATWLPARRATRVDPVIALKAE